MADVVAAYCAEDKFKTHYSHFKDCMGLCAYSTNNPQSVQPAQPVLYSLYTFICHGSREVARVRARVCARACTPERARVHDHE